MASLKFYFDRRYKRVDNKYPVLIYVNHRKHFYVHTGVFCYDDGTDSEYSNGMIVPIKKKNYTSENITARNLKLHRIMAKAEGLLLELEEKGSLRYMDDQRLKERIEEVVIGKVRKYTLCSIMNEMIDSKTNDRTKMSYQMVLKRLEKQGLTELHLDEIDRRWLESYRKRLEEEGMSTNRIYYQFRIMKQTYMYAMDMEYINYYPFRNFKVREQQTVKRALTVEQLRTLRNFECAPFQKEWVDMYFLMFYLIGINSRDLFLLTNDNIDNGRIVYTRAKTKKLYSIKLVPEAEEIINRYHGEKYLLKYMDTFKLPEHILEKMNKAIREVGCKFIGEGTARKKIGGEPLFRKLTSYTARHSWATIAAELDIPRDVIAQALGHSWSDVTSVYIKTSEKKVDDAQRKVIDYLLEKDSANSHPVKG